MKKVVLACVFAVVALMCFGGCKNKVKGDGTQNNGVVKVYKIGDEGHGGGIVFILAKMVFIYMMVREAKSYAISLKCLGIR